MEYYILYTGYRSRRAQPGTEHWTPKSTFYVVEDERCWVEKSLELLVHQVAIQSLALSILWLPMFLPVLVTDVVAKLILIGRILGTGRRVPSG